MVAKINTSGNLYGVLLCNLQKVDKDSGTVLATHIIREPTDGNFNAAGVAGEFTRWMPAQFRCEQPVLHISINPDPKDNLDNNRMAEIAEQYMDRMGWGGQPYIVFKHTDIDRTHIHIVSVQVGSDGRKIKDSMRNKRSWKVVQALEKEYGLRPAQKAAARENWHLTPMTIRRAT